MKKVIKHLVLFLYLIISFFLVSCNGDDSSIKAKQDLKRDNPIADNDKAKESKKDEKDEEDEEKENVSGKKFVPTTLPDDVKKLFVAKGNTSSNSVVIYEQGGPIKSLQAIGLEKGYVDNFKDFENFQRVYVHQTTTLNKNSLAAPGTVEQVTKETELDVEILDRVIKHFRAQGKKVYVMGYSFGAMVVTKYIANKGNSVVDKFVVMAGRLDMQPIVVDNLLKGKRLIFTNGIKPEFDPELEKGLESFTKQEKEEAKSAFFHIGLILKERYTQKITSSDLSNVIYAFANDDKLIGRLLESEKKFLKSKKATLIEVKKGGHKILDNSPHIDLIFKKMIATPQP